MGANTQLSSQLATINSINWISGTPIKFVLNYTSTGIGTLTLFNATTNATLATQTYTNLTNPLRVGNAIKLYVKQSAGSERRNPSSARSNAAHGSQKRAIKLVALSPTG